LLAAVDDGAAVAPSRMTVAEYLQGGLTVPTISLARRAGAIATRQEQIIPHLGATVLQKRPARIAEWRAATLKSGGKGGEAVSPRTVGHAHRVLHRALERGLGLEIVARNVAHAIKPAKLDDVEIASLTADQISDVLGGLDGHALHPIVALALGTGMRREEICALAWGRSIWTVQRFGSIAAWSRRRPGSRSKRRKPSTVAA
jgi:integrase